jgi:hypothetical protein
LILIHKQISFLIASKIGEFQLNRIINIFK